MRKVDLLRGLEWAFARTLYVASEIQQGRNPPGGSGLDRAVILRMQTNVHSRRVIDSLVAQAERWIDGYVDGKETCEDCGQLMERSYPLGLPEGAFVLVCRGCGHNLNHVVNPDMAHSGFRYREKEGDWNIDLTTDSPVAAELGLPGDSGPA